ncbi:MAG TPA: cytochrome c oxidase subunit 4 [Acidimicrobiales bacterium]|nr:cytochrome c oxidase subunit 4 [Acidimicrobiales bacterium]
MKVESRVILGAFIFLTCLCGVYWGAVAVHGHASERSGIAMLVFSFSAYFLLGSYLLLQWKRRHGVPRPEDRFDATQDDGAGVIDYFPSASIWPAGLGLGAIFFGMALVWGLWYAYIGGVLAIGSIIGWVTESDYTMDVLPGIDPDEVELGHDVASGATRPHYHTDVDHSLSEEVVHPHHH